MNLTVFKTGKFQPPAGVAEKMGQVFSHHGPLKRITLALPVIC